MASCDAEGVVTFFDAATGGVSGRVSLGQPVSACLVQADAITRPPAPRSAPLLEALARIGQMREPELRGLYQAISRQIARAGPSGSGGG